MGAPFLPTGLSLLQAAEHSHHQHHSSSSQAAAGHTLVPTHLARAPKPGVLHQQQLAMQQHPQQLHLQQQHRQLYDELVSELSLVGMGAQLESLSVRSSSSSSSNSSSSSMSSSEFESFLMSTMHGALVGIASTPSTPA